MEIRLLSNNYKLKTNKQNNKNPLCCQWQLLAEVCNIKNPTKNNNNNNLLDKKIGQLIKTLCYKNTTHFKRVLTKLSMKQNNTSKQNYKNFNNNISIKSCHRQHRVIINCDNKKVIKNVVNQNSVLSKKYNTFKRSFN